MNHRDIAGVMTAAAPAFRDYVVRAVSPLVDRLLAVEKFIRDYPTPKDGRDADPEVIAKMVSAEVARLLPEAVEAAVVAKEAAFAEIERIVTDRVEKLFSALPTPKDGRDADPVDLDEVASRAAKLLPAPENGKDADIEVVRAIIVEEVAKVAPEDGKDADPAIIRSMVVEEVAKIEPPKDGKDADPEAIKAAVLDVVAEVLPGEVSAAVEKIEKPKDGKDAEPVDPAVVANLLVGLMPVPKDGKDGVDGKGVTLEEIAPLVESAVASELAKIVIPEGPQGPQGEAGISVTVDDVLPALQEMVQALPPAVDGKDADPAEVAALIIEDVARLIPIPADGKSISIEDVLPVIEEAIEKKVSALPKARDGTDGRDGKDGIGLAGALLGRSGDLVLTLSDGTANSLGVIVGADGKDGLPGKDGMDGLGFDDLDVIHDGERSFTLRYQRGEIVKEQSFTVPAVLDRGVFKEGRERPYEKGDGVSFGGSFWISQKDAPEGKPGDGSAAWRLSVKKGRDGKDGVVRTLPPQGPVKA